MRRFLLDNISLLVIRIKDVATADLASLFIPIHPYIRNIRISDHMRPKPAKRSNVKLSSLILLQISPEPSLSSQALDKPLLLAYFNFMRQEVLRFKGG